MILRLLFALLLALPAFNAGASVPLDSAILAQALARHDASHGSFVQRRYLADLETTLESRGRYDYRRGERMVWRLEQPVAETLTLSADGIERDGRPLTGLPGEVSRLILSLLDGDLSALEARFVVTLDGSLAAWHARLVPRDAQLAQYLERAELRGGDQVTGVVLWLARGDRQTIELTPDASP